MYKIIGADKNEYGPVSADQLRDWIRQGRANANTLAQAEGATEWKPLSAFTEFAHHFAPKPPVPPPVAQVETEALAQEILGRGYYLDIGSCISRAWELLKADFWPIIGVSALIHIILAAASAAYVGIIVAGPLVGGLFNFYLKKIRHEPATLEDTFAGFKVAFLQLFLGALVSGVLIGLGFVCLILPGIYLAIAWKFTLPLIMDRRIDFWPAMELSRKIITRQWWSFFGFFIVLFLINVLGALACCVGAFVTAPLTSIALLYAYEDIFRKPAAHPV